MFTLRDWLRRPFCTWCSAFFFLSCSFTRAKSSRSTAQLDLSLSLASANSILSPSLQDSISNWCRGSYERDCKHADKTIICQLLHVSDIVHILEM